MAPFVTGVPLLAVFLSRPTKCLVERPPVHRLVPCNPSGHLWTVERKRAGHTNTLPVDRHDIVSHSDNGSRTLLSATTLSPCNGWQSGSACTPQQVSRRPLRPSLTRRRRCLHIQNPHRCYRNPRNGGGCDYHASSMASGGGILLTIGISRVADMIAHVRS